MNGLRHIVWMGIVLAIAAGGIARAAEEPQFSYTSYAEVLGTYVNDAGMVDYKGLKANRGELDAFARQLARLPRAVYDRWSDKQKVAFWINAYNALTLRVIIDNYPIKPSFFSSLRYPKNSIRQISGVWDKITFTVMGKRMTLEGIEHDTLRKDFNEPRIHVALVCAAMGCPKLRNEPYEADRLEDQFADQARSLLGAASKFRIDRARDQVHLSQILKWFGADFVKKYGTSVKFRGHDEEERAVLNFLSRHLEDRDRRYLEQGDYKIKYLDYDWVLNEQKPKS